MMVWPRGAGASSSSAIWRLRGITAVMKTGLSHGSSSARKPRNDPRRGPGPRKEADMIGTPPVQRRVLGTALPSTNPINKERERTEWADRLVYTPVVPAEARREALS